MKQLTLTDIIRQHYRKVRAHGCNLAGNFSEENIHAFRLEVKKLRAVLRMSAAADAASIRPRLPRNLDTFYTMTGLIRNLQLQRKGLAELAQRERQELPASCLAALDGRIEIAIGLATLFLKIGRPFGRAPGSWKTSLPASVSDAAGKEFLRRKMKLFPLPAREDIRDEEHLHMLRKALKDLLFVWPYLSKKTVRQAGTEGLNPRETIRNCAALLGDFRDACIRLTLLEDEKFLLCAGPAAKPFLETAGRVWRQDKEILRDRIGRILLPGEKSACQESTGNPLSPITLNAESYELHVD